MELEMPSEENPSEMLRNPNQTALSMELVTQSEESPSEAPKDQDKGNLFKSLRMQNEGAVALPALQNEARPNSNTRFGNYCLTNTFPHTHLVRDKFSPRAVGIWFHFLKLCLL